jgi:hypothetical protein
MGAAAIAGRLPFARTVANPVADPALAFHAPGGPLVAVCGLVGGAGASTLAYLVARRAARHSTAPVLLAELDDRCALAALVGAAGPLGLRELAQATEQRREVATPFAELPGGLRLVAAARPAAAAPPTPGVTRVLADARDAHGLVVVDGGQAGGPDSGALLAAASHVLFVLPASAPALRRAELLAAAGVFDRAAGACAALVAVATRPVRLARTKELRRLAERHVDRLLLVPHVPELVAGEHQRVGACLEDTFAALATMLRRDR